MHAELFREIIRVTTLLSLALLLGFLLGRPLTLLFIGLAGYLAYHLFFLNRLLNWLAHDRRSIPPEAPGIWGEVFHHLYQQYRRNRSRKQRIARLIRAFRDSTSAMPDGTVVLDGNWQIVWMNDAAEHLLGLHPAQDIGQRIGNLVRHPDFIAYIDAERFAEPLEIASPLDDERRLSFQVTPYGDGQRLLLVRDVTRLHRLEEMRREFVANASHELRTPLTVIRGYLEALEEDPAVSREWRMPLDEMRRQSERMSGIIEDLLELSRLETGSEEVEGEAVDIPALLARIREAALAMGEGPDDISLEIQAGVGLRGVEKEIYSAFSNLLFNAMHYTPKSGKVGIRWFTREDGSVCLAVEDTGIGVAREYIPRLTERFYRVDASRSRSKGGSGLGLAIVKHVLQRHGARLEIDSRPGKGSNFTCVFPAWRAVPVAS